MMKFYKMIEPKTQNNSENYNTNETNLTKVQDSTNFGVDGLFPVLPALPMAEPINDVSNPPDMNLRHQAARSYAIIFRSVRVGQCG
jgi:hypothetical protein